MNDIFVQIKQQAAKGVIVQARELTNLTQNRASFQIGDQIEFLVSIWNNNPFELSNLEIHIHQLAAVELEGNPVQLNVQHLSADEKKPIATIKGTIVENPDDAGSIYGIQDYLCRVKITGLIELPPIHFEDVELETINITDR